MATITPTYPDPPAGVTNVKVVKWLLGDADTGVGVAFPDFSDKTVTITGTFGSSTVVLAGSNDDTTYVTLADPQGNAMSKTAAAIEAVLENPLYIRASSSGGTGAATVVILTGVKRG